MPSLSGSPARAPTQAPNFSLMISCEHGGKRIPAPYRSFFLGQEGLLNSHRGFDPGALTLARELAEAFSAPLVFATISRLLVDLNRSVGHPRLHFESLRKAPASARQAILTRYYAPYRAQAEKRVNQAIASCGRVIHISSHTFTPELDGRVRNADIGLLYDPARPGEVALCERWRAVLHANAPHLVVRRNYPYAGKGDGLTRWFRQCLTPEQYVGIELEINQKHVAKGGPPWRALRLAIIESLRQTLLDFATRTAEPHPINLAKAGSYRRWPITGTPP